MQNNKDSNIGNNTVYESSSQYLATTVFFFRISLFLQNKKTKQKKKIVVCISAYTAIDLRSFLRAKF